MSGEAHTAFFQRTKNTTHSNNELRRIFENIIMNSPVRKHMKFYPDHVGQVHLYEKGGEDLPKWLEKELRFDGTFELHISTYESWYEDGDIYEGEREDSFPSLAKSFAESTHLNYYSRGVWDIEDQLAKKSA
ncbi:MAG: hypothetical protein ACR2ON_00865 [Paracoccaceae bacterium]